MKFYCLLLTTIAASTSTYADIHDGPFEAQGFSGEVSLLAGYGKSTSNLNTSKSSTISRLNSSDNTKSSGFLAPLGELRYTFDNQQVFIGTSRDDLVEGTVALALGYAVQLEDQTTISFSYIPSIVAGEAWEDPYQENTRRQKTDLKGNAYRLQLNNINSTNINGELAYYDKKIHTEQSGSSLTNNSEDLRRDGKGYLIGLSTGFPLTGSLIILPNVRYHTFSADGDAMTFDEYSLNLTGIYSHNQHAVSLNTSYAQQNYNERNPMFDKTRNDTTAGIHLMYEYSQFLGYKDWSLNFLVGYDKRNSNITFYDEKGHLFGIGLSHTF